MSRQKDHALLWVLGAIVLAVALFGEEEKVGRRKLTMGELVKLARDTGFPDADFAARIAMRESGGDPMAANDNPPRERSFGLWQINVLAHPQFREDDMVDPKKNAAAAFALSKHGTDWTPWSTRPGGPSGPPADDGDFEP